MNLQNKKNYLSKIIGIIALMMTLSVIFPTMSHVITGQSTSPNVAHAKKKSDSKSDDNKGKGEDNKSNKNDDDNGKSDDDSDGDDSGKDDDSNDNKDGDEGGGGKGKNMPQDKFSVMYAQIIMGSAIDQDKQVKNVEKDTNGYFHPFKKGKEVVKDEMNKAVSSIIGDGGVSLDINYSEMSYHNKQLMGRDTSDYKGGENGQELASTFRTFSSYGYINTVSGNTMVSGGQELVSGIGRLIGGGIAFIGLILFWSIRTLSYWLLRTLSAMNPYHFMGFKQGDGLLPDNPVSRAVSKFFEGFGVNGEVITTLTELGLIIILFLLGIGVIAKLTKADFKGAGESGKKWLVRIFVIFGVFPVFALTATGISKSVSEIAKDHDFKSSPAMSHLLDQRAWASGTNLSPSGLNGTAHPMSKAEEDYLDTSYVPTSNKGRNLIHQINSTAYQNLYGMTDETDISFALIGKWIKDDNFNVNTYMGDLRAGKANGGELPGMSNFKEVYAKRKGVKPSDISKTDLKSVIWSSTQNVNKKTKDVTNENFDPSLTIGSMGEQAFSTQSVALMLQSSFDDMSAKFYAYNFAPTGLQGNLKNLMTVKTEWKEMTLPGDGVIGVFGSWLSLIAESIAYICIALAVILALLTTNMFAAMLAFGKQLFRALIYGSVNSAMATFLIYLGGIGSVLISVGLPGLFIKLIQSIGDGITMATQNVIPSGFVDIITAVAMMFFAWYFSFGAKIQGTENTTPVKLIATLLVKMAMDFESRVSELDKRGGNTNLKHMATEGVGQSYKKHARGASNDIKGRMGQDTKRAKNMGTATTNGFKSGMVNTVKGGTKGAKTGAIRGFATGGAIGAVAGAGKGALAGGGKSALRSAKNTAQDINSVRKGQSPESIAQQRKDSDKDYYSKGYNASDKLKDYNNERGKHLAGSEAEGAKESAMKYGHMPFGIVPNKRLSEQTTADKDKLNKVTNESDLYKDNDQADMRKFSATAGQSAKDAVDEYNQPMFSHDEYQRLRNSENEDEFVDNLQDTNRGMEYAMNSTSAKTQLKDSRFTDDAGNISMDEIHAFQKESDHKFRTGNMSQEDWEDKSKLDSAFALGAQEKYRRPNNKFNRHKAFSDADVDSAKKMSVASATQSSVAGKKRRPRSTMNERKQTNATSVPTRGAKNTTSRQSKPKVPKAPKSSKVSTSKASSNKQQSQSQNKQRDTQLKAQQDKHKKQMKQDMKQRETKHREQSRRQRRQFNAMEEQAQREHDKMMRQQEQAHRKDIERRRQTAQSNRKKRANVKRLTANDVMNSRKKK